MWHTRSASDRPASAEVCGPCQPAVQGSLPSTPSDTLSDMHWSLWSLAMVVRRQRSGERSVVSVSARLGRREQGERKHGSYASQLTKWLAP